MLRDFLAEASWVDVVAGRERSRCRRGHRSTDAALVFLDVRLPEMSGLEVLQRSGISRKSCSRRRTINMRSRRSSLARWTTSSSRSAVSGFRRMLDRVRRRLSTGHEGPSAPERARTALGQPPLHRLFARLGENIVPIPAAGIVRIQAQGDYAEVHAPGGPYLLHVSLSELAGADPRALRAGAPIAHRQPRRHETAPAARRTPARHRVHEWRGNRGQPVGVRSAAETSSVKLNRLRGSKAQRLKDSEASRRNRSSATRLAVPTTAGAGRSCGH